MKFLLDTHTVEWARHADSRLSARIRNLFSEARPGDLTISDVTLTELARLLTEGRIKSQLPPEEWLRGAIHGFVILPVTAEIALTAAQLDWDNRDPCDRHIVATAAVYKLPLLTIDERMLQLSGVRGLKVIW